MSLIDRLKEKASGISNVVTIVSSAVVVVTTIISGVVYVNHVYTDIRGEIEKNRVTGEVTQIMILKKYVRDFETEHECAVSDQEWDEYILNYSTLFDLKIKNGMLSDKAVWKPVERQEGGCGV